MLTILETTTNQTKKKPHGAILKFHIYNSRLLMFIKVFTTRRSLNSHPRYRVTNSCHLGKVGGKLLTKSCGKTGKNWPSSATFFNLLPIVKPIIVYSTTWCLAIATFPSFPKFFKKKFWRCWNICFSMQAWFNTDGKVNINKSCYRNMFTRLQTITLPPPCELKLVPSATATDSMLPIWCVLHSKSDKSVFIDELLQS